MAYIRKVSGRHDWMHMKLKVGYETVPGIICLNCRAYRYGEDPDRPVDGCLSDIAVAHCGTARLQDHAEQEMRRRAEVDAAERAEDYAILQQAGVLDEHGRVETH